MSILEEYEISKKSLLEEKQVFYLGVAGFVMRVEFGESEYVWYKQRLLEGFLEVWGEGGFLQESYEGELDYVFEFDCSGGFSVIGEKKVRNTSYLSVYEWIGKRRVKVFAVIDVFGFYTLLKWVILKLLKGKGFMLHASLGKREGEWRAFLAPSGGGKSTSVKMYVKSGGDIFGDDLMVVRKINGDWRFYGSFGVEKGIKPENVFSDEVEFCFVKKGKKMERREISNLSEKMRGVLGQVWVEEEVSQETMDLVGEFVKENEIYELESVLDKDKFKSFFDEN